nr:uncharacterized protein LOC111414384 [Onthophagus taurus]
MKIKENLITLKCVLFCFFGGISCLFPFLLNHMTSKGLTKDMSWIISTVAACVAILGPAIAGPVADKFAGGFGGSKISKSGTYLRVMIAICMILSAVFYPLLLAIPTVVKTPPEVTFICDEQGGAIIQEGCGPEKTCYNWNEEERGLLKVSKCRFTCESDIKLTSTTTTISPEEYTSTASEEYDGADYNDSDLVEVEPKDDDEDEYEFPRRSNATMDVIPLPHLCYTRDNGDGICEVFSKYSNPIALNVNLKPSNGHYSDNGTEELCKYHIGNNFRCRIPEKITSNLTAVAPDCRPIVRCDLYEPYNISQGGKLVVSECGYSNISFWLYLITRSIADIFPAAVVTLLDAAVIIATRETSTGRGDVGKQFAAGVLGFALFAPIISNVDVWSDGGVDVMTVSLISFAVLMVLGAIIILVDGKMPLSPPEWWWHTRCGLLAMPMSSVKKYGLEIGALSLILVMLGIFWNAIDVYLPWRIASLGGPPVIVGLSITIGALFAIFFMLIAERFVDYCGHTNLLITAFVLYIIQYTGMAFITEAWFLLICEALEIFTLHLLWITAVLYLRHLIPRKFTVSGQALPVIAHFCLGRVIGAYIGGFAHSGDKFQFIEFHQWMAVAAAIIAIIYFFSYHMYLKPKCAAPTQHPPRPTPALIQNGNGSYTPLRVYHNGRAKKGQFRY